MTPGRASPHLAEWAGLALLVLSLAPLPFAPAAALGGWLCAFVLASGILLGGLLFLALTWVIPGRWQACVEAEARLLAGLTPWLPVLAIPLLAGLSRLYPWSSGDTLTGFKAVYLSPVFFSLRLVAILVFAALLSLRMALKPGRAVAVAGSIGFVLLDSLLATDLIQSLDPNFHSSGFGLYILALQMLTAFAAMLLLGLRQPSDGDVSLTGALFLTLLLCWPYFFFMQYFILWSGNLPPGAAWFARRGVGLWGVAETLLAALRLLPAFLLLFTPIRSSRNWLRGIAAVTLLASLVEIGWLILPEIHGPAWLGFGCFLMAAAGGALAAPLARRLFAWGRRERMRA